MDGLDTQAAVDALSRTRQLLLVGHFPGELSQHVALSIGLLEQMIATAKGVTDDQTQGSGPPAESDPVPQPRKRGRPRKIVPIAAAG